MPKRFPKVNQDDMWIMLLSTVRYSFGRRTYMSSFAGELVCRYNMFLTNFQIDQIIEEIEKEISLDNNGKSSIGDRCDYSAWKKNLEALKEIREKRGRKI